MRDLDDWLNSINPNLGKKKLPGFKELWKSGDLRERLVASNAKISSVRTRWQVQGALTFWRQTVLTTTTRSDCKSAHLRDWTLLRRKRQLSSNRCLPCSSGAQSGNDLVLSQCTGKLSRLTSIARRRRWATIHACGFILIGIILRS